MGRYNISMSNGKLSKLSGLDNAERSCQSIAELFRRSLANNRLVTLDTTKDHLDSRQAQLIDWLFELRPGDFGLDTPFYGLEEVESGSHFIVLSYKTKPPKKAKITQYLPKETYLAFSDMHRQFLKENPNRQLIVTSAYRSPAYQALLIFYYAWRQDFDLAQVLKRVALPGYSEHGLINSLALDLSDSLEHPDGYDPAEFALSPHFDWLNRHAAQFGFELSYPKNNPQGIDFEPWHWRFFP